MKTCLLVVDVQNDFCEGGALAVKGGNAVAAKIPEHLKRVSYDYVIASKDWHIDPGTHWATNGLEPDFKDTWPVHCIAGLKGSNFAPDLDVAFDAVFLKGQYEAAYSAFQGLLNNKWTLGEWLTKYEVGYLYICGIALDYCVDATVRDSVKKGFSTVLLPFLTASVDTDNHDILWRKLQQETSCNISVR